ncbi:MAG: hypothetical protein ACREBS_04890 [Nitrososphaerales archaeon]
MKQTELIALIELWQKRIRRGGTGNISPVEAKQALIDIEWILVEAFAGNSYEKKLSFLSDKDLVDERADILTEVFFLSDIEKILRNEKRKDTYQFRNLKELREQAREKLDAVIAEFGKRDAVAEEGAIHVSSRRKKVFQAKC